MYMKMSLKMKQNNKNPHYSMYSKHYVADLRDLVGNKKK